MTKKDEGAEQNANGQYVPPQQYAPQQQPKKSSNVVLVIVIVVVIIFGVLPLAGLILAGRLVGDFIKSPEGQEFIERVVDKIDDEINNKNSVIGTWDCKPFDSGSEKEMNVDYTTTLILRDNNTFKYGKYGDLENNSYVGQYKATREDKSHPTYKYYMLKFSDVSMTRDGEESETAGLQDLEMGITRKDDSREAVAMFMNYNMYYCYAR